MLQPDGALRCAMQLIDDPRNDLNSSPALGATLTAIGGESGEVFGVPYDYCLREGLSDDRCLLEPLGEGGVLLAPTSQFGRLLSDVPETIDANQPLTFSLVVRENDQTQLALIDSLSVEVTTNLGPRGRSPAIAASSPSSPTGFGRIAWAEP